MGVTFRICTETTKRPNALSSKEREPTRRITPPRLAEQPAYWERLRQVAGAALRWCYALSSNARSKRDVAFRSLRPKSSRGPEDGRARRFEPLSSRRRNGFSGNC